MNIIYNIKVLNSKKDLYNTIINKVIMKKKVIKKVEKGISAKISLKIKSIRRGVGMTQKDLAEALDITPQQIACYELGQTQLALERFLEIAEILKVDPIKLLSSCLNNDDNDEYSEHSKYSVSLTQHSKESNEETLDYKDFVKFMNIFKELNQSTKQK